MNALVNFKIAELLTEKGYNAESAHYFTKDGEEKYDTDFPSIFKTKPDGYYNRPTISDVLMWFYEKYEIWISVTPFKKKDNTTVYIYTIFKNDYVDTVSRASTGYTTINLAYEAAIEYCLKNLI